MINNLYVVGTIQQLIEEELGFLETNVEKNIESEKRKLVLQKQTPWGKLTNPKTKIGHYFKECGEVITTGGIMIDIASLTTLLIASSVFIGSECFGNYQFSKQVENIIKEIFNFAKYPFLMTLPFKMTSALKMSLVDKFHSKEVEIRRISKSKNEREQILQMTLSTLKEIKNNTEEFLLIRDFLNAVNLNGNSEEYNKELIILLAQATKHPSVKNFRKLSEHLRLSILTNDSLTNVATKEFSQNQFVKEIVNTF